MPPLCRRVRHPSRADFPVPGMAAFGALQPMADDATDGRRCPRPCENLIATNEQAIFCHWVWLWQYKEFGRAAFSAIELLLLATVRSFHTASGMGRHCY